MVKVVFKVSGMHCHSCELLVTDAVESITGNSVVRASAKDGVVEVESQSPAGIEAARQAILGEGYKVVN